jgi:KDO2-lipid IV(A) lauroyltransferase
MSGERAHAAPKGGRLRRWRKNLRRRFKHRPGLVPWLLFQPQRALLFLLGLLPESALMAVADRLGRLAWLSSRRRRAGRAQIAQALPALSEHERDRLLKQSCGHLGRSAAETMVASRHWPKDLLPLIQWEGQAREQLEELRGQGAVFVQAHLGSFEVGGAVLGQLGLDPAFPMRRPNNEYLARRLEAARSHWQVTVLARQGAVRQMLKHLKGGGCVILASDQNAHHAPVFPQWFGKLAATESASVRLARRLEKPLVVFWCVRDGGESPWRLGMEVVPLPAATGEEEQDDVAALEAVHQRLEAVILRAPEQYLWIHDRYRTRPAQESTSS